MYAYSILRRLRFTNEDYYSSRQRACVNPTTVRLSGMVLFNIRV